MATRPRTCCVQLRAHKHAFRINWRGRSPSQNTEKNSYKDLVKYSSEACFLSHGVCGSSSGPPRGRHPAESGSPGRLGPRWVFLHHLSVHCPRLPLQSSELLQRKGSGQIRRRTFHVGEGEMGRLHHQEVLILLFWRSVTGLHLALAHLLPLWDPDGAASG